MQTKLEGEKDLRSVADANLAEGCCGFLGPFLTTPQIGGGAKINLQMHDGRTVASQAGVHSYCGTSVGKNTFSFLIPSIMGGIIEGGSLCGTGGAQGAQLKRHS